MQSSIGPVYAIIKYDARNRWQSTEHRDTPMTTVRSQILVEGFVLQLDLDGFEFSNPFTNESVIVCRR